MDEYKKNLLERIKYRNKSRNTDCQGCAHSNYFPIGNPSYFGNCNGCIRNPEYTDHYCEVE